MYNWKEFMTLWERERITTEQAIGQLIVWGEHHHNVLTTVQRRQEQLEHQVKTLSAQVVALQAQVAPGKAGKS